MHLTSWSTNICRAHWIRLPAKKKKWRLISRQAASEFFFFKRGNSANYLLFGSVKMEMSCVDSAKAARNGISWFVPGKARSVGQHRG